MRPALSPEGQAATSHEQVWGKGIPEEVTASAEALRQDPGRLLLIPRLFLEA